MEQQTIDQALETFSGDPSCLWCFSTSSHYYLLIASTYPSQEMALYNDSLRNIAIPYGKFPDVWLISMYASMLWPYKGLFL